MEKVKITQEQADAIVKQVNKGSEENLLVDHARRSGWINEFSCLNSLTQMDMARALLNGYEVKPEFKVGDWVTNKTTMDTIEIDAPNADFLNKNYSHGKHFRHATPEEIAKEKERRWWAKHDRDVWEIKKDDSLIHDTEREYPDIIFEVGDFNIHFTDGHFYPKEYIKENYKVFCFAKDRKDVDHG